MEGVPAVPVRGQLALIWLSVALFLGRHFIITPYATEPYVVCNWPCGLGGLLPQGSHRPVRAQLTHTVPQVTEFAARRYTEWTTTAAGKGYRSSRRTKRVHG